MRYDACDSSLQSASFVDGDFVGNVAAYIEYLVDKKVSEKLHELKNADQKEGQSEIVRT